MATPVFDKALTNFLEKHKSKEFVRRILDPKSAPTPLMSDNFIETHRMAAEVDDDGNWFVFPTIVNDNGKLRKFDNAREALAFNAPKGEFIAFGKDKAQAIAMSMSLKTEKFNQFSRDFSRMRENIKPVGSVQLQDPNRIDVFDETKI